MKLGKRGPKPKPTAVRIFEGDPGRLLPKREGELIPVAGEICPMPPAWLGSVGAAVWGEVAPVLWAIGCLSANDERLLSQYCEAWEDFFRAREIIETEGTTQTNDKEMASSHPAVKQKRDATLLIKQIGAEFGMSPAARVGLKIGGQKTGNALKDFKKLG